jgi:hypothetical protein
MFPNDLAGAGPEPRVPNPESRIPNPEPRTPNPGPSPYVFNGFFLAAGNSTLLRIRR